MNRAAVSIFSTQTASNMRSSATRTRLKVVIAGARQKTPLCQRSCRPDRIGPFWGRGHQEVARYGQAYKDRIVARLLPPESSSVEQVSREVGVSVATLERWRADALANGSGAGSPRWTAVARLQAVIITAAMDEATRSGWCREQGLYPGEVG